MLRTLSSLGALLVACALVPSARAADATPPTDASVELSQSLLSMEEQVDALKEQVFRAKATMQLLQEIVASGPSGGSQTAVWYYNKLGSGYTVESVAFLLDGQARFSKEDTTGALDATKELKVIDGPVPPGDHTLTTQVRLRLTGFGLFKYARSYQIDVRSTYAFKVDVGKACTIRGTLNERSAAQSYEDRAAMEYDIRCERSGDATGN